MEFFKDENSVRCGKCGYRFRNPKISFDCAQWCAAAEECLGVAPETGGIPSGTGEGALVSRLVQALKSEYDTEQPRIARSLASLRYAKELLAEEGGDARTVLAAALLMETAAALAVDNDRRAAAATRILQETGFDEQAVQRVSDVILNYWSEESTDKKEEQIVADAYTLAVLADARQNGDARQLAAAEQRPLLTAAGRRRATP